MNSNEKYESNFSEKVLYEVIKLSFENKLEVEKDSIPYKIIHGSKAKYRCCVYKEREIVRQRVRLACGDKPIEKKKGEDGLLYIIDAACEECPINRYIVTENCQSCVSKRCQKACPFGAISIHGKRAYIEKDLCKECGKCKDACPFSAIADLMRPCMKSCPVDAISMDEERKAVIDYSKCIHCGRCMVQCPFGAISEKSDVVQVIKRLKSDNKVIAVVAPSIEGQFKGVTLNQIKQAIKSIGFTDVYEAALGAEIVAMEEAAIIEEFTKNHNFMTSSCCPAFVSLIHKHYPELNSTISPSRSPMIETAKLIREKYSNSKVVFIGPCLAKKLEIIEQEQKYVDYDISFVELNLIFKVLKINPSDFLSDEKEQSKDELIGYGRGFAVSGGVSSAVKQALNELKSDFKVNEIKANGIDECKKNLAIAKVKKPEFNFIEGMVCKDGCVGGPCCIVTSIYSKKVIENLNKKIY